MPLFRKDFKLLCKGFGFVNGQGIIEVSYDLPNKWRNCAYNLGGTAQLA
jgi:hypothetical protein